MTATQHRMPQRWKVLALLGGVILVIVVAAQFVRSDGGEAASEPAEAITQSPTTQSPIAPGDGPPPTEPPSLASSTPEALPAPVAPSPIPTAAVTDAWPTAPRQFALDQALLIGNVVVAPDNDRVWLYDTTRPRWHFVPTPEDISGIRCPTVLDETLTFVATYRDGAQGFSTLDLDTQLFSTTPLPATDYDVIVEARYCGAVSVNDIWATAASDGRSITFALSDDNGASFSTRLLALPAEWSTHLPQGAVVSTDTTLMKHRDQVLVDMCLSEGFESHCVETAVLVKSSVLDPAATEQLSLEEAAATVVRTSDDFAGETSLTNPGITADHRHRSFVPVGDEVWTTELVTVAGFREDAYDEIAIGRWAAGPLNGELIVIPAGFEPDLYPYRGGVAAELPMGVILPSGVRDRAPGTLWAALADGAAEWTWPPTPLTIDQYQLRDLPGTLHSVTTRPTGTHTRVLGVPERWQENPWATFDGATYGYTGEVRIDGERIYGIDSDGVWLSDDRGASWDRIPNPQPSRPCATTSESSLAHVTTHVEGVDDRTLRQQQLRILSTSGEYSVLELPLIDDAQWSKTTLVACKPVRISDRWAVAQLNLETAELTISITNIKGYLDDVTIDVSGEWRDAIGPASYVGQIDLYRDGDWVVARACSPHQGAQCAFSDIVFHTSLIFGPDSRVSSNAQTQVERGNFRPVNLGALRAAAHVVQVGGDTWRIDWDQPTGETTIGGEGADTVDVYTWLGGRLGEQVTPLPHGITAPREAPPAPSGQDIFFLFYGQVTTCDGPATAEADCWILQDDTWQRHVGPVSVDWATVPAGVDVSYSHRTESGQIMVIPTG